MGEKREELKRLKALLAQKEKENDLLREKMQTGLAPYPLTPETINNSSVPNYFGYFTIGDGLMVDKGFLIEKDVKELGLELNIPPFAKSNIQMPVPDVEITKKIAKHRGHVERAIAKVKKFKIVSGRIPNSMLGNINQIWFVVCMLSNFQQHIIQA
ncbi:hypothetical protein ABG768_026006 [Culter alburnus]|uniref:DDE Tnp4 domain-containing protein n=1 Tax=Culter alburnus TaxID=194366 RepID=A0AAW2AIY8_CULAL